ncbi:MAG: gamma-glutamylcyclotransferase [Telluria sp.]
MDESSLVAGAPMTCHHDTPRDRALEAQRLPGAASKRAIAQQISASHGPSGRNRDYLVDLAHALRELGMDDPHVFAIERHLSEIEGA